MLSKAYLVVIAMKHCCAEWMDMLMDRQVSCLVWGSSRGGGESVLGLCLTDTTASARNSATVTIQHEMQRFALGSMLDAKWETARLHV